MTNKIIRSSNPFEHSDLKHYIHGEWIVTNGLGGYASSTIIGIMTRKYHALLVSSLPGGLGRMIMLNHLIEEVLIGQRTYLLNCEDQGNDTLNIEALSYLKEFYLDAGLPVWRYQIEGHVLEKRIFMTHRQNTVYITYRLLEGDSDISLKLSPCLHFRHHEQEVNLPLDETYAITVLDERYEIRKKDLPPLRIFSYGDQQRRFIMERKLLKNAFFRLEAWRGYEAVGDLWCPGYFYVNLKKNQEVGIVASTESWDHINALSPVLARRAEMRRRSFLLHRANLKDSFGSELVLAADQFIITPENRTADAVRAHANGEEIRTIIAGYHWFTDWGRDTMISLEGLTLCTRRGSEARWILKTFAHYVRNGLIPNMFPEGKQEGLYHTADATMWFFHAIDRYKSYTDDPFILEELMPVLKDIIKWHLSGTRFGIGVDKDQLLRQGAEKYQLTWMDAKVGDWIVTKRSGKTVEINSLWYNALRLMEEWSDGADKETFGLLAEQVYASFNHRFWIADRGYLFDLIDGDEGDDDSFRPNQIFSISLKYPVLNPIYWKSVINQCKEKLLTPVGLRTLETSHPDFKPNYEGDLRSRDAAYHQGTVWPWLIGPFIDAWIKVYPEERVNARQFLQFFVDHLGDSGIGTICEICDALKPYTPRGCIAQAWSVAEVLRTWLKTAP